MDTREKLYQLASSHNIDIIFNYRLKKVESLSEPIDGTCAIAIDPEKLKSRADETVKLAHELGHCEKFAFYCEDTPLETKGRCEQRANVWAIKRVMPFAELRRAIHQGCSEFWQLADWFDVTEPFARMAVEYYRDRKGYALE